MARQHSGVDLSEDIVRKVRALYEKHPYPHYPLFVKLRWQDGYLSSSWFSTRLCREKFSAFGAMRPETGRARQVLLAGSGETLPYILRKNEPASTTLTSVDLSQNSLNRARWRTLFCSGPSNYVCEDLNAWLERNMASLHFEHIDAYGVLHHLPDPSRTLRLLSQTLPDGGTMRVMIYNRRSRRFLYHLRRATDLMGLTPHSPADLTRLRSLLSVLAEHAPSLGAKFACLGPGTLGSDARLADTFLHPREAQVDIRKWFDSINLAGLTPIGLYDRYAELDDLKNPLWVMPSWQSLEERACDGRFENNLELFLAKVPADNRPQNNQERAGGRYDFWQQCQIWRLGLKLPPTSWFSFEETRALSYPIKMLLWHHFINYVYGSADRPKIDDLVQRLPFSAVQRLVRLGAIFRGQLASAPLWEALSCPLHSEMEVPVKHPIKSLRDTPVLEKVEKIMAATGRASDRRIELVLQRLQAAQR